MRRAAFASLLCLLLFAATPRAAERGREWRLTILHFNDIHGHLEPWKPDAKSAATVGGIARIAALVRRIRAENRAAGRATILLEAGDVLTGTPMSSIYRGEPDVDAFNLLKVDAMAFGNHEFDDGQEQLGRLVARAKFPVLGANIYGKDGRPFAPGTTILEPLPGFRVGVIGLTTADTPSTTAPANVAGLTFDDPVAVARHAIPVLERDCDLVVALTHIGLPEDRRLAEAVPGVDAVIGGHTHLSLATPERVGETPICQAGDNGRFLGRLDLTVARMPGRVLRAALDRSAAIEPAEQDGGFFQVSGVRFAISNGRAADVVVAGEPLSDDRVYSVAMPAFLVAGGDGYTMLAPGATELADPKLSVDGVVLAYFAAGNVAAPAVDRRIVRR